jgi:hypothetical protein
LKLQSIEEAEFSPSRKRWVLAKDKVVLQNWTISVYVLYLWYWYYYWCWCYYYCDSERWRWCSCFRKIVFFTWNVSRKTREENSDRHESSTKDEDGECLSKKLNPEASNERWCWGCWYYLVPNPDSAYDYCYPQVNCG